MYNNLNNSVQISFNQYLSSVSVSFIKDQLSFAKGRTWNSLNIQYNVTSIGKLSYTQTTPGNLSSSSLHKS